MKKKLHLISPIIIYIYRSLIYFVFRYGVVFLDVIILS